MAKLSTETLLEKLSTLPPGKKQEISWQLASPILNRMPAERRNHILRKNQCQDTESLQTKLLQDSNGLSESLLKSLLDQMPLQKRDALLVHAKSLLKTQ